MTRVRAALLLALDRYLDQSIGTGLSEERTLSLLEVQKTAYFLQLAGWDSKWVFVKGVYGPYARELDQLVSSLEGHFLHGFGDGSIGSRATIEIDSKALRDAADLLGEDPALAVILKRFERLVEGFEYPYGIELLSTVHYVSAMGLTEQQSVDLAHIAEVVRSWSRRKRELFKATHLEAAYRHLLDLAVLGRSVSPT
jgi:hypothetical protein